MLELVVMALSQNLGFSSFLGIFSIWITTCDPFDSTESSALASFTSRLNCPVPSIVVDVTLVLSTVYLLLYFHSLRTYLHDSYLGLVSYHRRYLLTCRHCLRMYYHGLPILVYFVLQLRKPVICHSLSISPLVIQSVCDIHQKYI